MEKSRKITDLSTEEIRQIVTDIFLPLKVTHIKKHIREGTVTCKIHTKWTDTENTFIHADDVTLRNPFIYGEKAIELPFTLGNYDYWMFKQFCFAKGICPWLDNNPYLEEETK